MAEKVYRASGLVARERLVGAVLILLLVVTLSVSSSEGQSRDGEVSVLAFGARGDGSADDTQAIQAAIDTGKAVYLPPGRYRVTSPIVIGRGGAMLSGAGPYRTVINAQVQGSRGLWIRGDYSETDSNRIPREILIQDLTLVGNGSGPGTVGLEIGQVAQVTVRNVRVSEFPSHGILLRRPRHLFNVRLSDTNVISNGGWGVYSAESDDVYLLALENTWLSSNKLGAASITAVGMTAINSGFAGGEVGLRLVNGSTYSIIGCNFEANSKVDLEIDGAEGVTVIGPRFIGILPGGIPVQIQQGASPSSGVFIRNAKVLNYDLSATGKRVFSVVSGRAIEIGPYNLTSVRMGSNPEVAMTGGNGNMYWDSRSSSYVSVPLAAAEFTTSDGRHLGQIGRNTDGDLRISSSGSLSLSSGGTAKAYLENSQKGYLVFDPQNGEGFTLGGKKHTHGVAPPATGQWTQGDIVYNSLPQELGQPGRRYVLMGWICTAAGNPGKWLELRAETGN
jgi:Pectate lyase superfamily protein